MNEDDESLWDMFKDHIKTVVGILMFIIVITIFSNFGAIQRWIENFFGQF